MTNTSDSMMISCKTHPKLSNQNRQWNLKLNKVMTMNVRPIPARLDFQIPELTLTRMVFLSDDINSVEINRSCHTPPSSKTAYSNWSTDQYHKEIMYDHECIKPWDTTIVGPSRLVTWSPRQHIWIIHCRTRIEIEEARQAQTVSPTRLLEDI